MANPSAVWTGTIKFPDADLAVSGKLYSAAGRESRYTVSDVHVCPAAPVKAKKGGKKPTGPKDKPAAPPPDPTPVVRQAYCPACNKDLGPEEVGQCVVTPKSKRYSLADKRDLDRLDFKPTEVVTAAPVSEHDPSLAIFGTDTRYYFIPEPASSQSYAVIFEAFAHEDLVGFIPLLVIKGNPNVAVVRPISVDAAIFDDEEGSGYRQVLVVECVRDSDDVRDPADLPGYPAIANHIGRVKSDAAIAANAFKRVTESVLPDQCLNPRTAVLRTIVRSIRARAGVAARS